MALLIIRIIRKYGYKTKKYFDMYLSFDIKKIEGFIKNPSTCEPKTLDILKKQVIDYFNKMQPLILELVNKKISLKDISPKLFEEYKILIELKYIIDKECKN